MKAVYNPRLLLQSRPTYMQVGSDRPYVNLGTPWDILGAMTNKAFLIGTCIIFSIMVMSCGDASDRSNGTTQTDLHSEIAAFMSGYLTAVEMRDIQLIRESYVSDDRFVWLEDGEIRYRSVDELVEGLAAFPPDNVVRTNLSNLKVARLNELAATASAEFETMIGDSTQSFNFAGAISFVFERHEASWRIVSGHTSSR